MGLIRLTLLILTILASALAQAAETRIALVIGNSDYSSGSLPNPANDAKLIGDALTSLGFDVIARRNADQITMKRAIQEFGSRLESAGPGAVGLFYYAGHGLQLSGRNYLIPTTARIDREGDVEIEAVSADSETPYLSLGRKHRSRSERARRSAGRQRRTGRRHRRPLQGSIRKCLAVGGHQGRRAKSTQGRLLARTQPCQQARRHPPLRTFQPSG